MTQDITQLYPIPVREVALEGAFLTHELRQYRPAGGRPYFYTNFVTSIDGRIAIPREDGSGMKVPPSTANERDWRLFQELAAQADIIISSGRYLRDWAEGRAQEILQVDDPRFADLRQWRQQNGLAPQPDIAIISGSLDFPIPDVLTAGSRKVVVFTTADHDPQRAREIEDRAGQVIVAGDDGVSGAELAHQMSELGYHTVYSATGPKVHHLLLADNVLDRLYLTFTSRILGGRPFSSVVEGPTFAPALDLTLNSLYLDRYALDGLGQLFTVYDVVHQDDHMTGRKA